MPPKPKSDDDWLSLKLEVGTLFSGAPVDEEQLFAGRTPEIRRMLEAVLDRSQHVILFGERGVGKTSLANTFWKRYNKLLQTVIAARVQADPSDNFSSIWIKALEEIDATAHQIGKSELLPIDTQYEVISPDQIRREFQKSRPNAIPILIIDEFDKLHDEDARELTANVIKHFYDYSVNVTLIIAGVAEDVNGLIANHHSIRRALSEIPLERMTPHELNEVLDRRLKRTPLRISGDARWTIVTLSRGLPYYTQMLGKYSAQHAAERHRIDITTDDVEVAMDRFIEESGQSFFDDYRIATESNQTDNLFPHVLLACALAQTDESGFFTPTDVLNPLNSILRKKKRHAHFQRHLTEFISERRGNVLVRRGSERQYRYRFTDPMMQPYVIIKGIRSGMIPEKARSTLLHQEQPYLPNVE